MMKYTRRCDLREQNNKRSMLVKDVKTVEEAVCVLQEVVAMQWKSKLLPLLPLTSELQGESQN